MPAFEHIMGSEIEWGFIPHDLINFPSAHIFLFEHLPLIKAAKDNFKTALMADPEAERYYDGILLWLENMARFYINTGLHPEYSGPECRTSKDVLIWQKAGELMVMRAAEEMNKEIWGAVNSGRKCPALRQDAMDFINAYAAKSMAAGTLNPGGDIIKFYKNSIDAYGKFSWGEHENHLVKNPRGKKAGNEAFEAGLYAVMLLYLVSRVFWQGSLFIFWDESKNCFSMNLSQRERQTGEVVQAVSTTGQRAMIFLKQESLADPEKWSRLQIISGDHNMSETVIRLKYITVAMLIDMVEGGFFNNKRIYLENKQYRNYFTIFSEDVSIRSAVALWGKNYRATDLQQMLLDWALEYFGKGYGETTEDVRWGLEYWQKMIDLARGPDPWQNLSPYCDGAAKKILIERDMERNGYSWTTPKDKKIEIKTPGGRQRPVEAWSRVKFLDVEYHRVSKKYGLYYRMDLEKQCGENETIDAISNPPKDTRANARKQCYSDVFHENENAKITNFVWEYVAGLAQKRRYPDGEPRQIPVNFNLPDPFECDASHLTKAILRKLNKTETAS